MEWSKGVIANEVKQSQSSKIENKKEGEIKKSPRGNNFGSSEIFVGTDSLSPQRRGDTKYPH